MRYTTTAALLLHRFKFGRNLAAGEALAWCLIHRLRRALPVDCLLPVPISDRRLRARGFDQVAELARSLSRSLGTPVCWRSRRPIHRRPQSTLADDLARRRNVAGVFHVEPDAVAGRRVAIVDDVLTSGATASELARSARAAGAREVTVWVCARAMRASS